MIYLDNTTETQEIFIPRKAVEPEYSPMNRPLEVFIDNVKVQDNVMTYLRVVEPQSKDEGYSTVTVSMEVQMQQERLTDNGVFQFNEPVGTVEVDTSAYGEQRYEEGYNQGYTEGQENCQSCNLTTLEVTENGTYFPPITPVLVFDGDDVFEFAYADTPNAIEIKFKVNGSGWIFGNNEKAGLFAENTGSILVYWFGYEGRYGINDGEVNTILIKPYDVNAPIVLNGNEYNIVEREIDNTDTVEIPLGGGNFDFCYAKFWSEYSEYINGQTPLFYYLPNSDGNIKRSLLGGDFEVFGNRGDGVCQYTEISEFDGFSRVDVDTSAYGEQRYEEGYNVGYNERNNMPLQPINVADIIALANSMEVGASTPKIYFMRPTISRITQIDLNYGNARYWVTDESGEEIEVYRGRYYWGDNFHSENDIQVGQTVNLVCAVQNYRGTAQISANSYLLYLGD